MNDATAPSGPHTSSTATPPTSSTSWRSPDLDPAWDWTNEHTQAMPALDDLRHAPGGRRSGETTV